MFNLNSQRGVFASELHKHMKDDKDIILLTGDLGYGVFDQIRDDYPNQFINTGASEQALIGIGVGLALEGKKPFCYSITPFLLWRPAETIRLYVNHEKIPVRLIGGGRDKDYAHDGISHDATDARRLLDGWSHINQHWPQDMAMVTSCVAKMVAVDAPQFMSLTR